MRFSGKKVFITGASRGIGASIATTFRNQGAFVVGTKTSNESTQKEIICDEWVISDFSNEDEIFLCADAIKSIGIDILINNAGFNVNAPFAEIDLNVFKKIQQVNLLAPFILCQASVEYMKCQSWGRIVNVSSIFGKISKEGRASYSASKFALDGLTVALSAEYSEFGIMANCISPGFFDTDLTRRMLSSTDIAYLTSIVPARRLGKVSEIAHLVAWLSSEENTFLTGQNIAIDGGFTRV